MVVKRFVGEIGAAFNSQCCGAPEECSLLIRYDDQISAHQEMSQFVVARQAPVLKVVVVKVLAILVSQIHCHRIGGPWCCHGCTREAIAVNAIRSACLRRVLVKCPCVAASDQRTDHLSA